MLFSHCLILENVYDHRGAGTEVITATEDLSAIVCTYLHINCHNLSINTGLATL